MNIVKDNKDYTYWKYFIFVNNKLIQDNKKIEIKVYWQVNNNTTEKNPAHAYFEHRIFLSFLAGKFATFEQKLLTEQVC